MNSRFTRTAKRFGRQRSRFLRATRIFCAGSRARGMGSTICFIGWWREEMSSRGKVQISRLRRGKHQASKLQHPARNSLRRRMSRNGPGWRKMKLETPDEKPTKKTKIMRKTQSNAAWNGLSAEQRATLERWLFEENLGYELAYERAKTELGFAGSIASMKRFYQRMGEVRMLREI